MVERLLARPARRLAIGIWALALLGSWSAAPPATGAGVRVPARLVASSPWLDRLNLWRNISNVSALSENTTWSTGDYDHALYMVKNDLIQHYETPGTPYYTSAGDTAARNSNIFVSSYTGTTDVQAIDWWMQAPFHAMGMIDPRLSVTAFGSYRESKSGWDMGAALDVLRGNPFSGGTYPVYFPGNGTTEPLTSYGGYEFPDPLQACPGYSAPTGLPAFVQVGGNVATTVTAHSFTTASGTPLAHCVLDSNSPGVGSSLTYRGGAVVIPQQQLQTGTTYVVALTVNGTQYTWSFTVGQFATNCFVNSKVPPTPQSLGGSMVVFTARTIGCPHPLYSFWVLVPSAHAWTLAQAYSSSPTFRWNTAGLAAGTYYIYVWVRDAASSGTYGNSTGRWDSSTVMRYVVAGQAPPSHSWSGRPAPSRSTNSGA